MASRVTRTPLIGAPRAACAQVLPPGTRPLVSLARTILGGQLDERLLGTGLGEGEGEGGVVAEANTARRQVTGTRVYYSARRVTVRHDRSLEAHRRVDRITRAHELGRHRHKAVSVCYGLG